MAGQQTLTTLATSGRPWRHSPQAVCSLTTPLQVSGALLRRWLCWSSFTSRLTGVLAFKALAEHVKEAEAAPGFAHSHNVLKRLCTLTAVTAGSAPTRRGVDGRGPRGGRRGGRLGASRTGVAGRGMKLGATRTEKPPLTEDNFEF